MEGKVPLEMPASINVIANLTVGWYTKTGPTKSAKC